MAPLGTYQITPLSSRSLVTRSPTSSTVPVACAGVDDVADAVLVLEDHEDAGEEVLDQALRAEADGDTDDAGAGDDRADVDARPRSRIDDDARSPKMTNVVTLLSSAPTVRAAGGGALGDSVGRLVGVVAARVARASRSGEARCRRRTARPGR